MTERNDLAFQDIRKRWGYSDIKGEYFVENENTPLTKREYFAGLAMQGLAARGAYMPTTAMSEVAVSIADALIDALNKEAS